MNRIPLSTPLYGIRGMAPGFLKRLENLGVKTVRDLLWHFPSRYEDFSQIYKIAELEPGQHATIQGAIEDVEVRRTWKRRMTVVEAAITDESGSIRAVWFNQPYLVSVLRPGRIANFAGKVSVSDDGELRLNHPAYELVRQTPAPGRQAPETKHTARLVPIYPETKGLTSKGIRYLVQPVLKNLENVPEWIPKEVLEKCDLPETNPALKEIHFPDTVEEAARARRRFEFEDLFLLQLYNFEQKLKLAEEKAPPVKTDIEWLKRVIAGLPYELTLSQKKSLWEIVKDMERPRPMNRLLQGDVGSGKTVVAALAALITAKNGCQTAFMAPTEVLARQHFVTLKNLFTGVKSDIQPALALATSNDSKIVRETDAEYDIKKDELLRRVKDGEVKIAIGTHSLIQENVEFGNLGLVVVDEQHRFGVRQRQALAGKDRKELVPHFLSMSATPIPRTLAMTVFGDLDISTITEMPSGRKETVTKIVPPAKRKEAYEFIRAQVGEGRQAFVICPRIEAANGKEQMANGEADGQSAASRRQSALWDVKSVKEEYEKLSKKVFPDLKIAALHGKLKSKEKDKTMSDFRAGKTDILVSTSVVEVGVDVPNATIMMIEGADRFGLAQIYQFRGRVGRGEHQSYCFLFADSDSQSVKERLTAVVEAKNGFELAERDLKLRGPGELLGEEQTGMPDLAMRALEDIELVKASREAAAEVLQNDKKLKNHPLLKKRVEDFRQRAHFE